MTQRHCEIEDCVKPHYARGFCSAHYARWFRYGDPSIVKTTPSGVVQEYYCTVVLKHEGDDCLIWPYSRSTSGYGAINGKGRHGTVSRLVCEDIYGPPPSHEYEAAHSCGKGHLGCVAKSHLSWKTPSENQMDKLVHGTHSRGERGAMAKLTTEQVLEIISLRGIKKKCAIAATYGVNPSTISRIHSGKRWQDEHASAVL